MSVTEVHEALGQFEFKLRGNVPRDVLDGIQYFGHIAVVPGRVDARQYGDNTLTAARYVGVVRRKKVSDEGSSDQHQDGITISGVGMNFWLGDEEDKGSIIENEIQLVSENFSTAISAVMPPSVQAGTIGGVSGTYSGVHQWQTPRKAIQYICDTMSQSPTSTNLISDENSSFETSAGVGGWTATNASIAVTAAYSYLGTQSMWVTPTATSGIAIRTSNAANSPTVTAGSTYNLSYWIVPTANGSSARIGVNYKNGSFSTVSSASATSYTNLPVGAWTQVSRSVTVPTGLSITDIEFVIELQCASTADRFAVDYVECREATTATPVSFRVNNNGTLDAGPESTLFTTNPTCIIVRRGTSSGEDLRVKAIPSAISMDQDMEDFATRVVVLGGSDGFQFNVGAADIGNVAPEVNIYKDLFGQPLKLTKLVSEAETSETNADVRAELNLRNTLNPHREITISSQDYDIHGSFKTGDYVYVYDPDTGLYDTSNEIYFRGIRLNPIKLQVTETEWSITDEYSVGYRDVDGVWYDLTDYVDWETTENTKVTIGDFQRGLDDGLQDVGARLGQNATPDSSTPAAPTWTTGSFSTSVYLDSQGNSKASQKLVWSVPLNDDSSVITDGAYYELQFRLNSASDWDTRTVVWGQNTLLLSDLAVGTQYAARVRAVDESNNIGAWSSTTTFTTAVDSIAPGTPAAPSVAASTIAVQITHTLGLASGGTYNLDSDLAYLEVHKGSSSGFTADNTTLIGTVRANKNMMSASTPVVATFDVADTTAIWIKVKAVDTSGNKSAASAGATATAVLIDSAHISDLNVSKVTAGTISANWLLGASIRTASSGARVELNSSGFQAFDSGGNNTVNITNSGTFSLESPPSTAPTPVIEYVGVSDQWKGEATGTDFQINRPAGVQIGDLMLAFLVTNGTAATTVTPPTGWTQQGSTVRADAASDINLVVLKKTYALDDPSYWTGTVTSAVARQCVTVAYRGADIASNQFVNTPNTATSIVAGTTIANTLTNSDAAAWRIQAVAFVDDVAGGSIASTEVAERNDTSAGSASPWTYLGIYDSEGPVTAASHTRTATFTPGSSTNYVAAAAFMAYIKPLPTSSARMELDHLGLRAYNQVGTQTLDLAAASGSIDLQGTVSSFNYAEGVEGWRIHGDGNAQFESINILDTVGAANGTFENLTIGGVAAATQDFYQIKFPCVSVQRIASYALNDASTIAASVIQWDTKVFERNTAENSMWSAATPSRLKAPVDGIYEYSFGISTQWTGASPPYNTSTTYTRAHVDYVIIKKNAGGVEASGSGVARVAHQKTNDTGQLNGGMGSGLVALNAGDYIEFFSYTNIGADPGGSRILWTGSDGQASASLRYVSPLDGPGVGGTNIYQANFDAIACRTFIGDNTERPPNIGDWAYQGYYDSTYGHQKSVLTFDYAAIGAALTGKTILSAQLRVHVHHSYYSSMEIRLGTHNSTAAPASVVWPPTGVSTNRVSRTYSYAGSTYYINLGTTIANEFKAGTAKGIVFGPAPDTGKNFYGYMTGYQPSSGKTPQLRFTYTD